MEGNEIKRSILESVIKQQGIPPAIGSWLLRLEEIITKQGAEIEELKNMLNAEPNLRIDYKQAGEAGEGKDDQS